MTSAEAFIAAHRFGLGPRGRELWDAGADPAGWVRAQIRADAPVPPLLSSFPSTRERLQKIAAAVAADMKANEVIGPMVRDVALPEILAQYTVRVLTETPFLERMVAFWANHFTVIAAKGHNRAIASAFQTEAIRPHVFGRFEDLLFAAETHPAMLIYLDNVLSVGPRSTVGQRGDRSFNENLARETLELHTLGVDGGYTQQDVEALARILTGWSSPGGRYAQAAERIAERTGRTVTEQIGQATFYHPTHEPGPKTLLGKTYQEAGPDEFRAVARDLAAHPSTARFLATKLVRHFVADDPPADAVRSIERAYQSSGGDLAAVSAALVALDAAWSNPLAKVKSPDDFVVASLRAVGSRTVNASTINGALVPMGQQPLTALSPQGWPDTAEAWVAPGSLMARIEFARLLGTRVMGVVDPATFLEQTIGPVASDETRRLVAGAPTGDEAIAFVLASREFQRR